MTGVQTCALPICFPVTIGWHLAQRFSARPLLNGAFINEDPPIARVSAVNTSLTNQFIFDSFFNIKMARPMPMYSVPGSVDHF